MLDRLSDFDQFSFLLGFVTAALVIWLSGRLFPLLRQALKTARERRIARREALRTEFEYDYRNDFNRHIQGNHLAAALFSLDEIVLPPRLLAPPPQTLPGEDVYLSDTLSKILPYMPGVPEFASVFGAEKLTLAEALSRGANLALFGPAGSGKTTALAHLGSQIASLSPDAGSLVDMVPFYVHAADLALPVPEETDPFDLIYTAILDAGYLSRKTAGKFQQLIEKAHRESRALLLIDGLDELGPDAVERVTGYIQTLLVEHQDLRIVTAVSLEYFDGITQLGFHPVCMAGWTEAERQQFLRKWCDLWVQHIDSEIWGKNGQGIEPQMLLNWLENDRTPRTPLEVTLRAWAVFAGDSTGPANSDSLDAFLRRMASVNSDTAETALERIGMQMVLTRRTVVHVRAATHWSRGNMVEDVSDDPADEELQDLAEENGKPGRVGRSTVQKLLSDSLFVQHPHETIRFCHPVFAGYFAGRGIANFGGAGALAGQGDWNLKDLAMQSLAARTDIMPLLKDLEKPDSMHTMAISAGRWLREMPPESSGRRAVMRRLVALFQDENEPAYIRQQALARLAISRDPVVTPFCRKLLTNPDPLARSMAALGLGYVRDRKTFHDLSEAASDPAFIVRAAACFALVQLGTKEAIETVASLMLRGDEDTQHAAAEALAVDPDEGFSFLMEASEDEDLLVRRASIFGLGKNGSREAIARIRWIQLEDDQWVVRNAATQELLRIEQGSPAVPAPFEVLHLTSWLVSFAGETGEGLAPGRAAKDTLFRALVKGSPEQQIAAMDRYRLSGTDPVWTALHEILKESSQEVKNAALQTLWLLRAQGLKTDTVEPAVVG